MLRSDISLQLLENTGKYYNKMKHWSEMGPGGNYIFKFNNRSIRTRYDIYSELTIKTPERRH